MITLKKILNLIGSKKDFVFVSIGANDGIFVDEVYNSNLLNINWDCHFIEPVKKNFDSLIKNYGTYFPNNKFKYYNYAIHNNEGLDFLITNKVDDSLGMCSFFRSENQNTIKIEVEKKTFKTFLEESKIKSIDFLKIDTEGMDFEIILQCFESGIYPDLILFESISLNDNTVRGEKDLYSKISELDYNLINDIAEFQYEEHNKLIVKKSINYV